MKNNNYLAAVKAQYEELPYPPVDPQDEKKRLQRTWLEDLPMMNHYCYQGRESFRNGFRVLVAGGGTGDATIFLAEQLRGTDAEIVHLDLSAASIRVAQERAAVRGLTNIGWLQESILDLPGLGLGLGKFDYINCAGVLHHLIDPDAGLRALRSVLKERGAIGLMVYGAVGRTGVYHLQEVLRLAGGACPTADRIVHAKEVLDALPPANWYRRASDLYGDTDTDAGIVDSLLHPQDRAYTVGQLFEWLQDQHGFTIELSDIHRGRFPYLPQLVLGPEAARLRARLGAMSERERYAMSELLIGDLTRHTMYLTPGPAARAPYGDAAYVPFFFHENLDPQALESMFAPKGGKPTVLRHDFLGMTARVDAGNYSGKIFRHIDGQRSFQEIFDLVRADPACRAAAPGNAALFSDFKPAFDIMNAIERLLLRHQSC